MNRGDLMFVNLLIKSTLYIIAQTLQKVNVFLIFSPEINKYTASYTDKNFKNLTI